MVVVILTRLTHNLNLVLALQTIEVAPLHGSITSAAMGITALPL